MTSLTPEFMIASGLAFGSLAIVLVGYMVLTNKYPSNQKKDPWTAMYERVNGFLTRCWKKLPYRVQSVIIIGTWLFIIVAMVLMTISSNYAITNLIWGCLSSALGIFYIYHEMRGTLRKRDPE